MKKKKKTIKIEHYKLPILDLLFLKKVQSRGVL